MAHELIDLTGTELKEKGAELANAVSGLYAIRAEKKSAMNDFKSKIDDQEKLIGELSMTIQTGREMRSRTFFDNHIDDE